MIKVKTRNQVKGAKRKLRAKMKNYRLLVKDVAERSELHENTVKDALNPEHPYWSDSVVALANTMISEKKQLSTL